MQMEMLVFLVFDLTSRDLRLPVIGKHFMERNKLDESCDIS